MDVRAFDFVLGPNNKETETPAGFEIQFEAFAFKGRVQRWSSSSLVGMLANWGFGTKSTQGI